MEPPTYDPTDFGNEPGLGALRPGGMEPEIIDRESDNLPSTRSPASEAQQASVRVCRDLWRGNSRLKGERGTDEYLPRAEGESPTAYRVRKRRSVFHNFYRRTVEGLTGLVFRVDPILSDDVPDPMAEHWENIDLEGTHGDVFVRERLEDALIAGHGAILVEFPTTDGSQTMADEQSEIRPYWVPIKKEDLMSWRTEKEHGRRVLTQVVIRERRVAHAGLFGERDDVLYRVLTREVEDGKPRVEWTLIRVTDAKEAKLVNRGVYGNQDEIPIVEVPSSGRLGLFESDPPLLDFGYLNISHYQTASDLSMAAYKTCVPLLFFAGVNSDPPQEDGGPAAEVVVGPNSFINAKDPNATGEYIAHDGRSLEQVRQMLEDLKSDMGTLGLAMLAPQKRTAETAEAKRLDKATSDSALSVTARALQDAIEQCLHFHAKYLKGAKTGGSITINRDFEGMVMEASVMSAYAQLVNAGMPPRIALEMLRAGGRISEDADLDELERDWLMGAAVSQELAGLEPAA